MGIERGSSSTNPGEKGSKCFLFLTTLIFIILFPSYILSFQLDFRETRTEHFNIFFAESLSLGRIMNLKNDLETAFEYMTEELRILRLPEVLIKRPINLMIFGRTGDFTYHTGLPYWSASAMVSGNIYLQPLEVLIKRGVSKTVINHEVALVFIYHLSGGMAPPWLAEGLAVYLSGEYESLMVGLSSERPEVYDVEDIDELLLDRDDRTRNRWGYVFAYEEVLKTIEEDGIEGIIKMLGSLK